MERRLPQDQVQLGIKAKVQLWVGILGQARVVGKIPYTCNHLIVAQWIFGNGDLKITGGIFALQDFPHLSINHLITVSNLFSATLSIFGDLLLPSRFA